jgi:transcriptional regulator with XRE-family HTH domain
MPKKLGKAIRYFREKKGLTQQQAADSYGCTLRWWQTMEYGTNISLNIMTKVSKVLSIPRWKLLK